MGANQKHVAKTLVGAASNTMRASQTEASEEAERRTAGTAGGPPAGGEVEDGRAAGMGRARAAPGHGRREERGGRARLPWRRSVGAGSGGGAGATATVRPWSRESSGGGHAAPAKLLAAACAGRGARRQGKAARARGRTRGGRRRCSREEGGGAGGGRSRRRRGEGIDGSQERCGRARLTLDASGQGRAGGGARFLRG